MAEVTERTLLLKRKESIDVPTNSLSVLFAIICIVDVFGVFPIIALSKSVINCGYYGILVVAVVCGIQIYTATLLGRCWLIAQSIDPSILNKSRYPYAALTEMTYGTTLSKFATFLLDITIFGAGIPNLIVASQNLQLLGMRLTNDSFDLSFCYWILVMGMILCPVLWLGSPKDMKLLCALSVFLVISVFFLVWSIIVFDPQRSRAEDQPPLPRLVPLWNSIFSTYGILSFQFDIHPTILTIQVDMKEKDKVGLAVLGGFAISLGIFSLTCIATAVRYGDITHASLLETLPSSMFLHLAAFLVALQLGLSSAVGNSALYQHMEDFMNISRDFNHKRCILRTCLTIVAILVAESVPRFDLVMSLIGGTLTGPLVFIFPPLFFIKILQLQKRHEQTLQMESLYPIVQDPREVEKSEYTSYKENTEIDFSKGKLLKNSRYLKGIEICFCLVIAIAGICTTVVTTYVNVVNTIEFATFSPPCIVNLTSATIFVGS